MVKHLGVVLASFEPVYILRTVKRSVITVIAEEPVGLNQQIPVISKTLILRAERQVFAVKNLIRFVALHHALVNPPLTPTFAVPLLIANSFFSLIGKDEEFVLILPQDTLVI